MDKHLALYDPTFNYKNEKTRQKYVNGRRGTIRNYPERNNALNKKMKKYRIAVFISQSAYDQNLYYCYNKHNRVTVCDEPPKYINNIGYLWKFCNEFYGTKLDTTDKDISYQEMADLLKCKIIVNENLNVEFYKNVGYTAQNSPRGYGGGSVQITTYKQRGNYNNGFEKENANNTRIYYPFNKERDDVIVIFPPPCSKNYQFTTQMKKDKPSLKKVCECCWRKDGRIWMLRGHGNKSYAKTKGLRKERYNEKVVTREMYDSIYVYNK